eukprot:jgi/Undpi1/412/HiC_scaffold_1.g00408.m1
MNGFSRKREVHPPGPYFPFHRDETYPRTLCVNFKRLEYRTLQKYCKLHAINVRPDSTQAELAVAAARHFQEAPSVDEEGVMTSFLSRVIVPDRPFRPAIDLALVTMGNGDRNSSTGSRGLLNSSIADSNVNDLDGVGGGDRGAARGGGGGRGGSEGGERDGSRGMHNHDYRHGHGGHSPMGGGGAYDEKPRLEGYPPRGMGGRDGGGEGRDGGGGGGGGGGRYEHDMDYGRSPAQMSSPWENEGHGREMMPKAAKRSGGARGRCARGATSSAPAHGGGHAITDRGMPVTSGGGSGGSGGGGGAAGGGEETKSRKRADRSGGGGAGTGTGAAGAGGGNSGEAVVKAPPLKKRKGGGGWRAKNGEQVAVRDDREEVGAWILARVIKYVPETHQYELKDDDDKEGMGGLTAPRSLVIRLEETTKGVLKGDRVLAVFPDTTSFYVGTVHRVPKAVVGCERRIEVKFNDDADDNGRTPARPLPARYVVPLPEGFDEEEGKVEEEDGDVAGAVGGTGTGGGGGGAVGGGEEDAEEPMGTEDDDAGEPPYVDMIRTALLKMPGRQGNLPAVYAYIEEHFHDRLNWKSESSLRRTPAWKSSVRRTLAHNPSFCHAGTPERNVYTLAE